MLYALSTSCLGLYMAPSAAPMRASAVMQMRESVMEPRAVGVAGGVRPHVLLHVSQDPLSPPHATTII